MLGRHTGEGRYPAGLLNMPLVLSMLRMGYLTNWIPAFAGMTE
jgi:hypothetical protein